MKCASMVFYQRHAATADN